ncbi:hypothetical protein ACO2Q8_15475 [Larkinella sp. VNQ87]|uniref:hypothetical protein n=1 Tax=Larkinella sp. VNQ87 TaxID=3400921 RepID=UPI003C0AB7F2
MDTVENQQPGKEGFLLCPSYIAKPGAQLFGILNAEGRVSFLRQPIPIDHTFVEAAREGRPAEERFRFAGKCVRTGCHQWSKSRQACTLVERLLENRVSSSALPDCPIRNRCRWFHQRAETACQSCNEVIRHHEMSFAGNDLSPESSH